jgi:hypothetical protein
LEIVSIRRNLDQRGKRKEKWIKWCLKVFPDLMTWKREDAVLQNRKTSI